MSRTRIKNSYLIKQLGTLVTLGGSSVSLQVFVEAWREKGFTANDEFFLHLETLVSYEFIRQTNESYDAQVVGSFSDLLSSPGHYEASLSVTHNGSEFLHRYG